MAKPKHIEWLLEGVEYWNKARKGDPTFVPDFSKANIYFEFFKRDKLSDIGEIPLAGINLTNADLSHSTLYFADLTNANLSGATLTGSRVQGSKLSNANLIGATVDKAHFTLVDLNGANLTNTNYWKANLRWNVSSAEQHSLNLNVITSIESLLSNLRKIQQLHPNETIYLRGHSNFCWKLSPSLVRYGLDAYEGQMLTELVTHRPEDFSAIGTALDQWVLAQHHGLKTRFLDVTKNPLVALYFACEEYHSIDGMIHIFAVPGNAVKTFNSDTISIISNFAKLPHREQTLVLTKQPIENYTDYHTAVRHLYHNIRQEKPYFEQRMNLEDLFREFIVAPQSSIERVRAQSGAFLASAFHQRFEREQIFGWTGQQPIYAHYSAIVAKDIGARKNIKQEILNELRLLNITRDTLYPGLDESARAITESYRQRLKDSDSKANNPAWVYNSAHPNYPTTGGQP